MELSWVELCVYVEEFRLYWAYRVMDGRIYYTNKFFLWNVCPFTELLEDENGPRMTQIY